MNKHSTTASCPGAAAFPHDISPDVDNFSPSSFIIFDFTLTSEQRSIGIDIPGKWRRGEGGTGVWQGDMMMSTPLISWTI